MKVNCCLLSVNRCSVFVFVVCYLHLFVIVCCLLFVCCLCVVCVVRRLFCVGNCSLLVVRCLCLCVWNVLFDVRSLLFVVCCLLLLFTCCLWFAARC